MKQASRHVFWFLSDFRFSGGKANAGLSAHSTEPPQIALYVELAGVFSAPRIQSQAQSANRPRLEDELDGNEPSGGTSQNGSSARLPPASPLQGCGGLEQGSLVLEPQSLEAFDCKLTSKLRWLV